MTDNNRHTNNLLDFFSGTASSNNNNNNNNSNKPNGYNIDDNNNTNKQSNNRSSNTSRKSPKNNDSRSNSPIIKQQQQSIQQQTNNNNNTIDYNTIQWRIDEGSLYSNSSQSNKSFEKLKFINKQLNLRSNEYTDIQHINIYCGTYNTNGKKAPSDYTIIQEWITKNFISYNNKDKVYSLPEICCFGFQELVDLDAKNLLVDHNECKPWQNIIQSTLNYMCKTNQQHNDTYVLISSIHLVGLAMFIYVRKSIEQHIHDIRSSTVGVGLMGVGGNKGAVVTRFDLYNSSLCFVNTHLAAHQKNIKARNNDFHSICKRCALLPNNTNNNSNTSILSHPYATADEFYLNDDQDFMNTLSSNFAALKTKVQKVAKDLRAQHTQDNNIVDMTREHDVDKDGYGIYDHQHVFWIGDLNYRIDTITIDEVYALIETNDIPTLLLHEQLMNEKSKGNVFVDFEEGQITFLPTYKYITDTNMYDRREGSKQRIPAYCDRIQWLGGKGVKQLYYTRAECTLSDHKPVMALFSVPINIEIESKKINVQRELSELTPELVWSQIALSTRIIELNDIYFDAPFRTQIHLKNIGKTVVEYNILWKQHHTVDEYGELITDNDLIDKDKPASTTLPSWLKVIPVKGIIQLNQVVTLTVTIRVGRKAGSMLNTMGDKSLLSLLLIKCIDGGYHSIGLRGLYHRSILGNNLSYLCKLRDMPIAVTPVSQIRNNKKSTNVPYIIQTLIDAIDKQLHNIDNDILKTNTSDITNELHMISESNQGGQLLSDNSVKSVIQMLDNNLPIKKSVNVTTLLTTLRIVLLCLSQPLLSRPTQNKNNNQISEPLTDEHIRRRDRLHDVRHELMLHDDELMLQDNGLFDVPTYCYLTLSDMPTQQYCTLIQAVNLFRRIISNSNSKHTTTTYMTAMYSPCLTFRPAQSTLSPTIQLKPQQILRHIIEADEYV